MTDFLAGLPQATMTLSGFWDTAAPPPPVRRRIEIKLNPRRPAFVTYAVIDETGSFTLTGDEARSYARHFSPKYQARMRRMRSSYPTRWRRRS